MTSAVDLKAPTEKTAEVHRERWLAVVSHTDPRYGGLSAAVPQGELEIAARGQFEVALAAFCKHGEQYAPAGFSKKALTFWPTSRSSWLRSSSLRQRFTEQVQSADGVHIHGLWEASTAIAARTAHATGKPYIVSAHGMLEPWALAQGRLKKKIYSALIERQVITGATCLHALTRAEAAQYRSFGAQNPIAVIPNAVQVPERITPESFFQHFPDLRGRRILLYLGRLHPKKGLDLLKDAWLHLSKKAPDWQLVLAGPDAEGTEAKLRQVFTKDAAGRSVTFTGMLGPDLKWSALAASEAFVLPSYSEGLSMGVLEALGAKLPVVITRNCNLPEVVAAGAGWEVRADASSLTEALQELMASTQEQNRERGLQGGYLVTSRYNPGAVAQQMSEVYNLCLHGIQPQVTEMLV